MEPDVWKIEGLDRREDCENIVTAARRGGRDRVGCIILGRGEDEQKVHEWLSTAATVPGFIGFAVGRTSFWDPACCLACERRSRATDAVNRIAAPLPGVRPTFSRRRPVPHDGDTIKIAPSILAADFARLGAQVAEAERAGADRIHIDVMDGHFVPNLSMGAPIVASLRRVTHLPLETHLMISNPDAFLDEFVDGGRRFVSRPLGRQREPAPHRPSHQVAWQRSRRRDQSGNPRRRAGRNIARN